jgi:hypothetical protein
MTDRAKTEGSVPGVVARLVAPYLLLVGLHVALSWVTWQPTVFFDELGYLGNARYLAGRGCPPNLDGFPFYHCGYSLLIVPAFWLSSDPAVVFKAIVVLNGLMLSGLFFCFYHMLRRLFDYPERPAVLVSFVGSLFPAYLLHANMALCESGFILFYGLLLTSFGALLWRRTYGAAVLFGAVAAYCYAIHPRALPLLPVSALAVLALAVRRQLPMTRAAAALAALAVVFVCARAANAHLKTLGWGGADALSTSAVLSELLTPTGMRDLAVAALGQLLYLCQASYGLFALGVLEGVRWVRSGWGAGRGSLLTDPRRALVVFLFATSLGILGASSAIMAGAIEDAVSDNVYTQLRGDHLIYGRYNEPFLGFYVVLGLHALHEAASESGRFARQFYGVLAFTVALTLGVLVAGGHRFLERSYYEGTIWGIFPLIHLVQGLPPVGWGGLAQKGVLGVVSLASLAIFVTAARLAARRYRAAVGLIGCFFLAAAAYGYHYSIRPVQMSFRMTRLLPEQVARLGGTTHVSYDMTYLEWQAYGTYQYFLPDVKFEQFWSERGQAPSGDVVVSGTDWRDADRLGARLVWAEKPRNNALWVLPGDLQARLPSPGPFLNVNVGGERVAGVPQEGFDRDGMGPDGPVRWTKGAARLTVPLDCSNKPRGLHVALAAVGPTGTQFRMALNGKELCDERIEKGPWEGTFDLTGEQLGKAATLELLSDTFQGMTGAAPRKARVRGVLVRDITFRDR